MKNVNKIIGCLGLIIFLFTSLFPLNNVFAAKGTVSSNYFFSEEEEKLERSQKDEILKFGELLNFQGVDLIINTKIQNNKTGNEECKDIFYNYMKKGSSQNKVIVLIYYTDNKELQIYDDYGIFSDKDIQDLQNVLKKFQSNDKLGEGLVFSYKTLAKKINKELNLKIVDLNDMTIENPYKRSIFTIRNALVLIILVLCLFGFRRNKEMPLN